MTAKNWEDKLSRHDHEQLHLEQILKQDDLKQKIIGRLNEKVKTVEKEMTEFDSPTMKAAKIGEKNGLLDAIMTIKGLM